MSARQEKWFRVFRLTALMLFGAGAGYLGADELRGYVYAIQCDGPNRRPIETLQITVVCSLAGAVLEWALRLRDMPYWVNPSDVEGKLRAEKT